MQQINLYTAEFQPRKEYLSLRNVVLVCAAVFAVGMLIAVAQAWRNHTLRTQIVALQVQTQNEQTALSADKVLLTQHVPSAELTAQVEKLNTEASSKQSLLTALQSLSLTQRQGYSRIMSSLGRHPLENLWLTHIDIFENDVNLAGVTRNPELVPGFIDTLVKDEDFGPRGYQSLTMKAVENGLLNFELRGKSEERKLP